MLKLTHKHSSIYSITKRQSFYVLIHTREQEILTVIKKMKSGSYKVKVFYPKEAREIPGVTSQRYGKTFSLKNEALVAEKDIPKKIGKVQLEKHERALELKANTSFKEFYEQVWLDMYYNGSSGRNRTIPSE